MKLKFKTVELQQEEVLNDLPKAIRSGIAQHLFRNVVENAYLFKGVSEDFIVQMVKLFCSIYDSIDFHESNISTSRLCMYQLVNILAVIITNTIQRTTTSKYYDKMFLDVKDGNGNLHFLLTGI